MAYIKARIEDFTQEEIRLVQIAALAVWEEIACDCFVNENGEPDESVTLSQETVLELVSDAMRVEEMLKRMKHPGLAKKLGDMSHISDLFKSVFKNKIYGY